MISKLLNHKIRKDLLRHNKQHNHKEYLSALAPYPRLAYWSAYHKKKLISFALASLLAWHYEMYEPVQNFFISLGSPRKFITDLVTPGKVEKTIKEQ
jgi:hypothetical protein